MTRAHVYRRGFLVTVIHNGEAHECRTQNVPTAKSLKEALEAMEPTEDDSATTMMRRAIEEVRRG